MVLFKINGERNSGTNFLTNVLKQNKFPTYVEITKHTEKNNGKNKHYLLLYIGKICFTLESSKEYSVDIEGDGFVINVSDFSDEQTLIDTMIEKCKEYNHL
jgi:hypothetical protein